VDSFIVYHVVTEKPMYKEQQIVFDDTHHNGVYNRVMTYKRINEGENMSGDVADLIKSDLDKWSKVSYRELTLEKVRAEEFPQYPSRMACLYTSQTLEEAKDWAKFFKEIGRRVYTIVRLRVNGRAFSGDACNCFDGVADEAINIPKARQYWKMDVENNKPVIETIVDGEIFVEEIIEEYD
jgi:hypothetical protein